MQAIQVTENMRSLALLPGSFHPITTAHLELARAALQRADRVLFVLPRSFPHKSYDQVTLQDRLDLIRLAIDDPRMEAGVTEGGLFIEMVRECRRHHPGLDKIYVVCGRDAAERIVSWDYDGIEPIDQQLREYELLVAARNGDYRPPAHLAAHIHALPLGPGLDEVSATALRDKIRKGGDWEQYTPPAIRQRVRELYSHS
jgi:nicotinic acid mononucleotide adenylyltransferase